MLLVILQTKQKEREERTKRKKKELLVKRDFSLSILFEYEKNTHTDKIK